MIREGAEPFVHAFLRMAISPSEWAEKITSTTISPSDRYLPGMDGTLVTPRVLPIVLGLTFLSSLLR